MKSKIFKVDQLYTILEFQKAGMIFAYLEGNRLSDDKHVERMKESIIKLGRNTSPITLVEAKSLTDLDFKIKDQYGRIVTDSVELESMFVPLDGTHRLKAALKIFEDMKGKPEHELPKITGTIILVKDKDYVDSFLMEANINSKVWDSEAYLRSLLSHAEYNFDRTRLEFAAKLLDEGLKVDNALRLATGDENSIPTKTQLAKACESKGEKSREKLSEKRNVETIKAIYGDLKQHLGTNLLNCRPVTKQLVRFVSNTNYLANDIVAIKSWLGSITPDDTVEMASYKNSKNGDSKDTKLHKKMEEMYNRWKK